MKKNSTEFTNFRRAMDKAEAAKLKAEEAAKLKSTEGKKAGNRKKREKEEE